MDTGTRWLCMLLAFWVVAVSAIVALTGRMPPDWFLFLPALLTIVAILILSAIVKALDLYEHRRRARKGPR